jgi:hypothetical protein
MSLVAVVLVGVVPVLAASVALCRYRRALQTHRRLQLWLTWLLGLGVLALEVEVRSVGWRHRAAASPYLGPSLDLALSVHLAVATLTAATWAAAVAYGVRAYRDPRVDPGRASRHRVLGRLAAAGMAGTAGTGWLFYWMAFVA